MLNAVNDGKKTGSRVVEDKFRGCFSLFQATGSNGGGNGIDIGIGSTHGRDQAQLKIKYVIQRNDWCPS